MISSNSMSQTNVREGYRITTLEVVELIEDLISYYSAKVKIEDLSNTLTLILSKTAQRRSSSVVFNRSIALITNKFGVASLTKPAILNDANVALVDAVHHSVVIDALTMTLIKNNNDLLGTVNSHIKSRRLRARCKTEAADSRHAKASGGRTKKDKDSEDSNTSSDQLGKEAQLKKTRDEEELAKLDGPLDSDDYCLDSSLDIDSKDDSEDEEATTAKDLAREQKERLKALLNANDPLALRFCFFSNSPPENISRLTKEEAMEMRIDTTNAISKALAAANKLVALQSYIILEANTPAVHPKATKHRLAPLVAQFVIVCGFRKVDKHVFRAYNTISVTAQRTIIRKGSSYVEKRAILLPALNSLAIAKQWRNMITNVKHDASEHESSYEFMLKRILKTRDLWGKLISGIKSDFLPYFQSCLCLDFLSTVQNAKQQCRDILEKEGLNKLEASRRVIFNCFKMQAIASYSALATLKAAQFKTYSSCKVKRFTLNSIKDLFTNLSKDYFLVREARAITKSSLKF
ncbi:hypothetical protein HBH82_108270 [Parastagonospora nodorum]|nr:hypothetical protein HBH82_108270 [Parastagonospora nodorum]KAH4665941.1 hypothetical protein HBH78_199820 [Parastagonospora nodorum]KAH4697320.1 hypothetical protein HBH67_181340 [Parastagonospora nodorum]KAH4792596.1 hypothetical protein HBH62_026790 [Parastagonospora nodorum]